MVGVANTAVYYLLYLAMVLVLTYLAAHVVAWAVSFVFSFFANCRWTYGVRPTWRRFTRYPWSAAVNVTSTTVGVWCMVELLGLDARWAPLLVGVAVMPLTYVAAKAALLGRAGSPEPDQGCG